MCSVLNCAISVILGKDCTRPGVLWGSVLHLCWKHLSQLKPTFIVMKCFKQSIIFLNFHFRGKLRSSGVLFQYLLSKIIFLWQVAQCLWTGATPYWGAGDSKLKPTFPSNHHTFIFWMLQFYPNEQIKLHKTKKDLSLQHSGCCSFFLPGLPGARRVQPCREDMAGRLVWGSLSSFGALAGVTRCPHAPSRAGAGVWLGCLGTAEGEVGSSTWHCSGKEKGAMWKAAGELLVVAQRAMPQKPPWAPSTCWAEPGSERGRVFWKKGYRLQTDKH